ncbi:MAG: 5'/3'-nucleotidase SurE [Steroidobacteraceae bacterium]
MKNRKRLRRGFSCYPLSPVPYPLSVLALAVLLAPAVPTHAALCSDRPLDLLLTNDDGIAAPGLEALRDRLRAKGHRVTVAAPDYNASGSSTSVTWRNVRVTRDEGDAQSFAVAGTPATAVVLAATALYPDGTGPDLVISGINDGDNAGTLLVVSGTVGAALAGSILLDPPIPGIAFNAPRPDRGNPVDAPGNRAHLAQAADYFVRFVEAARGWFCEGGDVVRARTVLNVNYPPLPVERVRGTVVTHQGRVPDLRVQYVDAGNGEYSARLTPMAVARDDVDSDRSRLEAGYVSVTPVSATLDDQAAPRRALARRLRKLDP